jgi:hypothetical protein
VAPAGEGGITVWRTSSGERALRGAEWELFRAALAGVWDLVEDSPDGADLFESGIGAFDDLQRAPKLALLALVGQALQDEATPPPRLTAHTEGTVAAVLEHVRQSVELEIDADDPGAEERAISWRRLILEACREGEAGEGEPLPEATCDDLGEWGVLVECLSSRILWDDDYQMGGEFLDVDPEEARARMKALGIADDYYLAPAPDPTAEQLEQARRTLRQLTGRPEPEGPELLPGLDDAYHGLLVGPCAQEAVDAEAACRLVHAILASGEDGFDCSYQEWAELFRDAVLRAAQEPPAPSNPEAVLLPEQRAAARRAEEARAVLEVERDHRIEPREGGWVVVDAQGWCLVEVDDGAWAEDKNDPDLTPLVFPSAAEALAAFVRSDSLAHARAGRHQEALKRLGVEPD